MRHKSREYPDIKRAAALAMSLLCAAPTAWSADDPVPPSEKGHVLAQKLCAGCHVLPGQDSSAVPVGVPTFRAIANRPGQTGDHIAEILIKPHAPMPDLQMTRAEIADILAYLETLRTDAAQPQLAPSPASPPPVTPRKS